MEFKFEKKIAIEAVHQAALFAGQIQKKLTAEEIFIKPDHSPVTIVDYCCQVIINYYLLQHFPGDEIMGEEDAEFFNNSHNGHLLHKMAEYLSLFGINLSHHDIIDILAKGTSEGGKTGRFWTIDPIDGTKGFLRQDHYAIALALLENGVPIVGALAAPTIHSSQSAQKGLLFLASRNQGCFSYNLNMQNETKLHMTIQKKPETMIYCEPHGSSQSHSHSFAAKIAQKIHAHPQPFQIDSQCKYGLVANQESSIYMRLPSNPKDREKIWDHAAGTIIVEEAGGKVTDVFGKTLDFSLGQSLKNNLGIIASNGWLHEEVIAASKSIYDNLS